MIRPSTKLRYEAILRHYRRGVEPKQIVVDLNLLSIKVVYKALEYSRNRRTPKEK